MERPDPPHGILGRHGVPLRHLRAEVHGIRVVAALADACQGPALQGLHHSAVQPQGGHGPQQPRAQPAGCLPRRDGHHGGGAVPAPAGERGPGAGDGRRRSRRPAGGPAGLDDHPVDPAVQHGPDHRRGDRVPHRQDGQPLYRGGRPRGARRRPARQALRGQEGPGIGGARDGHGRRLGRPAVRAVDRLGPADGRARGGVPRDSGRLRDHGGRHRHRAHRPNLRCRRRPGRAGRRGAPPAGR